MQSTEGVGGVAYAADGSPNDLFMKWASLRLVCFGTSRWSACYLVATRAVICWMSFTAGAVRA